MAEVVVMPGVRKPADPFEAFRYALARAANALDEAVGSEEASLYWMNRGSVTGPWALIGMLDDAEIVARLFDGIREAARG